MKNRIAVSIAGQEYTLVSEEEESYVQQVAAYVDEQMRSVSEAGRVSLVDSAVLSALNIADELFKEKSAEENLRTQVKTILEESNKLKLELAEANRKIFGLQNRR